jgi:hypothetical protein
MGIEMKDSETRTNYVSDGIYETVSMNKFENGIYWQEQGPRS